MFFPNLSNRKKNFPKRDVTKAEFVKLFMDKGMGKLSANVQATLCEQMGSRVEINGEMVGIKEET